jgi:hypothetical protein
MPGTEQRGDCSERTKDCSGKVTTRREKNVIAEAAAKLRQRAALADTFLPLQQRLHPVSYLVWPALGERVASIVCGYARWRDVLTIHSTGLLTTFAAGEFDR